MQIFIIAAVLLAIFILLIYLIAPGRCDKSRYKWFTSTNFAHRGLYSSDQKVPENSIEAFRKAVDAGYGIEFDIEMTKDNIPVVFHDDNLKRMTGMNKLLRKCTYGELQTLSLAKTGYKIPLLSQVLALINGRVPLIIEIKTTPYYKKVCSLTLAQLRRYQGKYCVESFNPLIVMWFRKNAPQILRGQLSMVFKNNADIGALQKIVLSSMLLNVLARPQFIAYRYSDYCSLPLYLCRKFGALTVCWTIHTIEDYKLFSKKFDAVIFESFCLPKK